MSQKRAFGINITLLCENIGEVSFSFQWRMKMNSKNLSSSHETEWLCSGWLLPLCCEGSFSSAPGVWELAFIKNHKTSSTLQACHLSLWLSLLQISFILSLTKLFGWVLFCAWILKDHIQEPKKQRNSLAFQSWSSEIRDRQVFTTVSKIKKNDVFKVSYSYVAQINICCFFFLKCIELVLGPQSRKGEQSFCILLGLRQIMS